MGGKGFIQIKTKWNTVAFLGLKRHDIGIYELHAQFVHIKTFSLFVLFRSFYPSFWFFINDFTLYIC